MAYAKGVLSGVAAMFAVLILPGLIHTLWDISREKATGLAFVRGGLVEALSSPLFWVEVFCLLALFLATGRLSSRPLRVLLFWAPTLIITTLGSIIALFTFLYLRFRS
jgi:hypothetical protein